MHPCGTACLKTDRSGAAISLLHSNPRDLKNQDRVQNWVVGALTTLYKHTPIDPRAAQSRHPTHPNRQSAQPLTFAIQLGHCPVLRQQPGQQQMAVCEQCVCFVVEHICLACKDLLHDVAKLLPQITQECSLAGKVFCVYMSQRKPAATAVATCSGCDCVEGRKQGNQEM